MFYRIFRNERGMALITMLLLLSALSILAAGAVVISGIDLRLASNYYQNSRAFYAAEAGVEKALSDLQSILDGQGTITDEDLATILPPDLDGFSYDEFTIVRTDSSFVQTMNNAPYIGMIGLYQPIEITSRVTGPGNSRYSIVISVQGIQVPIFQFGVFYNDSLEIHNGPRMDFIGRVHTNSDLFLGTNTSTLFYSPITVTGDLYRYRICNEDRNEFEGDLFILHPIIDPDSNWVLLNKDSEDYVGDDEGWVTWANDNFGGRLSTRAHNVTPPGMPIPGGIEPIKIIKRRDAGDGTALILERLDWQADLRIYSNEDFTSIQIIDNDGSTVSLTDEDAIIPTPDAFYDDREGEWTDLLVIDVSLLDASDIGNGIVYVSIEEEAGRHKGVKLINCEELPGPMSICSDNAVYIQGDYNTVDWQPSAVMADAVNLLSNSWTDAANPEDANDANDASSTIYYVAILSGDTENAAAYNGGLENFPRFLENWSGQTCTIYGSFVNLFLSENAVGQWSDGSPIYTVPICDWYFDVRFQEFNNLPPGTPSVGSVLRISFRQEFMS